MATLLGPTKVKVASLQEIVSNLIGFVCKAQQFELTSGSQKCVCELAECADKAQRYLSYAMRTLGETVNLTGEQYVKDAWFPELKPSTKESAAEEDFSKTLTCIADNLDRTVNACEYPLHICNKLAKLSWELREAQYNFDHGTHTDNDKEHK